MAKKPSKQTVTRPASREVLVATQQFRGGSGDDKHVVSGGSILTDEDLDKLGMDEAAVLRAMERGAIIAQTIQVAPGGKASGAKADKAAQLALEIEQGMESADIRTELDGLKVSYETDANKPALAALLAQARLDA